MAPALETAARTKDPHAHVKLVADVELLAEARELSSCLAGMARQCDPEMQEELRVFVQTQGEDWRELARWLDPDCQRPLWQIALLGMLANKGVIMLSTDVDCDGQLIALSAPLSALVLPVDDPASSPYESSPYESSACEGSPHAIHPFESSLDTAFEEELAALSLTAGDRTGAGCSGSDPPLASVDRLER